MCLQKIWVQKKKKAKNKNLNCIKSKQAFILCRTKTCFTWGLHNSREQGGKFCQCWQRLVGLSTLQVTSVNKLQTLISCQTQHKSAQSACKQAGLVYTLSVVICPFWFVVSILYVNFLAFLLHGWNDRSISNGWFSKSNADCLIYEATRIKILHKVCSVQPKGQTQTFSLHFCLIYDLNYEMDKEMVAH